MKLETLGQGEGLSRADVWVEQDGAHVTVTIETSGREEATLTPDQARALASGLTQIADTATTYANPNG